MNDHNVDKTLYVIHKLETDYRAGGDIKDDLKALLSYRKFDGGWGHLKRASTNFHTAHAVRAFSMVKYADQKIINAAVAYLKSRQNKDGGWGFRKGDESAPDMAATVMIALSPFKENLSLRTTIDAGTAYLLSFQNPDGSFSEKPRR